MYHFARQMLFQMPEETAHHVALSGISWANRFCLTSLIRKPADLPVDVMGIRFPNPVGVAAGLDKNGECIDGLASLGFGFVEFGTVTPRPQPGNPQPRLFRIPEAQAIINRMGFNNLGIDHLVQRVEKARYRGVIGINIGKNFDTPVEEANRDYLHCLRKAYPVASYIVVNISSPNTKGLRSLQSGDAFAGLLNALKEEQDKLATQHGKYVPLVVKIAPDLEEDGIREMAEALLAARIDGVIATNTTITRPGLEGVARAQEQGGLSGLPLRPLALKAQQTLCSALGGKVPVIGVGGIMTGADAAEKIKAGASLVQLYTGFIYEGPGLVYDSVEAIRSLSC